MLHLVVDAARHGLRVDDLLAGAGTEPVDAEPARQLAEPGPDGLVVAQLAEMLVGAGEDLLEDLLGVLLAQPEGLAADRVDVARERETSSRQASSSPLRQRATSWASGRDVSCTASV